MESLDFVKVEMSDSSSMSASGEAAYVEDVMESARQELASKTSDASEEAMTQNELEEVKEEIEEPEESDHGDVQKFAPLTCEFRSMVDARKEESGKLFQTLLDGLFYGQADALSMAFDRVKERPYLDSSIDERKKRFSDALNNPQFTRVHKVATNAERFIQRAKQCAGEAKASVFSVCDILDKIQPVFKDTCSESVELFQENVDAREKLNEYDRCEMERQAQLIEFNVEAADQLQTDSILHLGEAVELAEEFSEEVEKRVNLMREQNRKAVHSEYGGDVTETIFGERQELNSYSLQCHNDIIVIKATQDEQKRKTECLKKLHEKAACDVSTRQKENKERQEELERQLRKLKEEQNELEEEEDQIEEWHSGVEEVISSVDERLLEKRKEMEDLEARVDASLTVIDLIEECSKEVMATAEEILGQNEKDLRILQMASTVQLRSSLVKSAVAFSVMMKDCETNVGILNKTHNAQLAEMKTSAKSGLTMYVKKLKEENTNLKEEIKRYQAMQEGHMSKLAEVTQKLEAVDAKLKDLDPGIDLASLETELGEYEERRQESWDDDKLMSLSKVGMSNRMSLKSM